MCAEYYVFLLFLNGQMLEDLCYTTILHAKDSYNCKRASERPKVYQSAPNDKGCFDSFAKKTQSVLVETQNLI